MDRGSPGDMPHPVSETAQIHAKHKGFENAFIFWWQIRMEKVHIGAHLSIGGLFGRLYNL